MYMLICNIHGMCVITGLGEEREERSATEGVISKYIASVYEDGKLKT
jgi:hypothetical protein